VGTVVVGTLVVTAALPGSTASVVALEVKVTALRLGACACIESSENKLAAVKVMTVRESGESA
jgi:hypothetical protein